jgi:hypothetical protein
MVSVYGSDTSGWSQQKSPVLLMPNMKWLNNIESKIMN